MFRILLMIIVSILPATAALGQLPDLDTGDPRAPWHIMADRLYFDEPTQSYIAEGNVSIVREGRILTADRVVLDDKTRRALAEGDVRLVSGSDQLYGRRLDLDLDRETGILSDGTVFIAQNHLYISGSEIEKTGPESYSIRDATLTSCDGPAPAWRITSRQVEVTVEGYGTAQHAALWVRRVPVVYTPYLLFPVKLERQSGLLAPSMGYSQRNHAEYMQPLYWAISDNSDATFFVHHIHKRGLRSGLEYRYVLSGQSFGAVLADGLKDRQVDDGTREGQERWGFSGDDFGRPNDDRYWLRAKANQALPAGFRAMLDLDLVSDQDYLREFRSGQNGFDYTQDYFRQTFIRDIDDYDEVQRLNRLNVNRLWNYYTLNADISWTDNVIKRRRDGDPDPNDPDREIVDDTLQQLPVVSFDGIRQSVGDSPFYLGFNSSYTHFYREDAAGGRNTDRGQRADFHPRIYYPFYMLGGVSVEPSAGVRQTTWHIDRDRDLPVDGQRDYYRSIYDLRLDISTEFFRVFNIDLAGHDRLRHAIVPEVVYDYIPDTVDDQSQDLPLFTRNIDRISRANTVTYGVTNYLTARKPLPVAEEQFARFGYLDFFRLKLFQSFDINEYNEHEEEKEEDEEDSVRPFSDITAEMDFTPRRFVSLISKAEWSPYDSRFNYFKAGPRLWDDRGDFLSASYVYRRDIRTLRIDQDSLLTEGSESVVLDGQLIIDAHWLIRGEYEYDVKTSELVTSTIGFGYRSQCWGIDLDYREEPGNRGFVVFFTLVGLGTFGQ